MADLGDKSKLVLDEVLQWHHYGTSTGTSKSTEVSLSDVNIAALEQALVSKLTKAKVAKPKKSSMKPPMKLDHNDPLAAFQHGIIIPLLRNARPHTQKARGIHALTSSQKTESFVTMTPPSRFRTYLISSKFPLGQFNYNCLTLEPWLIKHGVSNLCSFVVMARPCPSVPRHGFVESRVVTTPEELKQVIIETRKADPRGEVILMPYIEAQSSAVVTDSSVTIGKSNNGATAGKQSFTIPCVSNIAKLTELMGKISVKNGQGYYRDISIDKYTGLNPKYNRHPYIETVEDQIVQLRYGPKVDGLKKTHSPIGNLTVRYVWEPSESTQEDFEEFESCLNELYRQWGCSCVLYLPHGSLSCHTAVQAIVKGICVVTGDTKKPKVGAYYNFGDYSSYHSSYTTEQYRYLLEKGLTTGATLTLDRNDKASILWAVSIIQGLAAMPMSEFKIAAVFAASGILLRYGLAACFGEHRHFSRNGPTMNGSIPVAPVDDLYMDTCGYQNFHNHIRRTFTRSIIQEKALTFNLMSYQTAQIALANLVGTKYDFENHHWIAGYGGKAWVKCCETLERLFLVWLASRNRIGSFVCGTAYEYNETNRLINELTGAANAFICTSHNTGKCLTKFVTGLELLYATTAPGLYLTNTLSSTIQEALSQMPAKDAPSTLVVEDTTDDASDESDSEEEEEEPVNVIGEPDNL